MADTPEGDAAATGGAAPPVSEGDNRRGTAGAPADNSPPARRLANGRFAPGASANPTRRFSRGQSGNPKGRPLGKFRAGTRAAAALLDAQAEALAQKAIELALGGDPVAVRFCLGRVLGVRRGQQAVVELDLRRRSPRTGRSRQGIADGANGRRWCRRYGLTPDEALSLAQMLDGFPRILTAGLVGRPPADGSAADPRQMLLDELARIAAAGTVAPRGC